MEFLGFLILVVIFVFVNFSKKPAQKSASARNGMRSAAQQLKNAQSEEALRRAKTRASHRVAQARQSAGAMPEAAVAQPRVAPIVRPAVPVEGESMLDDEACRGGSMAHAHTEGLSDLEDEECVGGSMAHSHDEGVSRSAHARRMAAIDSQREEASGRERSTLFPNGIDARDMRRAVVMAEVLGRPKAMRRVGNAR